MNTETCVKTYAGNTEVRHGIESMARKGWRVQHMAARTSGWWLKRGNHTVVFERDVHTPLSAFRAACRASTEDYDD